MVKIHFLNVGHGDCTIIEHASGHLTVIDINNGDDIDPKSAREIAAFTPSLYDNRYLALAEAYGQKRAAVLEKAGYSIRLTNSIEYLTSHYPGWPIFRFIQSHPDLDHMRGLAAVRRAGIAILNFWDTTHGKVPDDFLGNDEEDWDEYQTIRTGKGSARVLRLHRGDVGTFWNQLPTGVNGGDGLHILAPTPKLIDTP